MIDALFTKKQLLELSGMDAAAHTYCSREELMQPANEIRRGVTPKYDMEEMLVATVAEALHTVGYGYRDAFQYVRRIQKEPFWQHMKDHAHASNVWVMAVNGEEFKVELVGEEFKSLPFKYLLYRADTEGPPVERFSGVDISKKVGRILELAGPSV